MQLNQTAGKNTIPKKNMQIAHFDDFDEAVKYVIFIPRTQNVVNVEGEGSKTRVFILLSSKTSSRSCNI